MMAVAGTDGAAVAAQPVEVVRFGSECNYSARTDTEHNKRIVKGNRTSIYQAGGPTVSERVCLIRRELLTPAYPRRFHVSVMWVIKLTTWCHCMYIVPI